MTNMLLAILTRLVDVTDGHNYDIICCKLAIILKLPWGSWHVGCCGHTFRL